MLEINCHAPPRAPCTRTRCSATVQDLYLDSLSLIPISRYTLMRMATSVFSQAQSVDQEQQEPRANKCQANVDINLRTLRLDDLLGTPAPQDI